MEAIDLPSFMLGGLVQSARAGLCGPLQEPCVGLRGLCKNLVCVGLRGPLQEPCVGLCGPLQEPCAGAIGSRGPRRGLFN